MSDRIQVDAVFFAACSYTAQSRGITSRPFIARQYVPIKSLRLAATAIKAAARRPSAVAFGQP